MKKRDKEFLTRLEKNSDLIVKYNEKLDAYLIYQEQLCNIKIFYKDFYEILISDMSIEYDLKLSGVCKKYIPKDNIGYYELLEQIIFSGLLIILKNNEYYLFDLAQPPSRTTGDTLAEPDNIFGSRDGFVENFKDNIALLRTRLKSANMHTDEFYIGKRSKTYVALLSIADIHNEEKRKELVNLINTMDIDCLTTIEDFTAFFQIKKMFPLFQYIGSADIAARSLENGQFLFVIDRIPVVICMPITIGLLTRQRLDRLNSVLYNISERAFMIFTIFFSMFFLGALSSFITYQSDSLSIVILSTLKNTQSGVIFPGPIQILFTLLLFELAYLISFRQPKIIISSSILLIGGLIIGQNMIDSGIVGVLVVTLTALAFLSSFVPSSNVTFIMSISITRIILIIASFFFGIYGLTIASCLILYKFHEEKFLGVHFFAPFIPFQAEEISQFFIPTSNILRRKRPNMLEVKDKTMKGK